MMDPNLAARKITPSVSRVDHWKARYFVRLAFGSYPLDSLASASSPEIEKADMKRGIIKEISDFLLSFSFPWWKSTPRLACAFLIRSVSSVRVGIKRRAKEIDLAILWTGTKRSFRGANNHSLAFVLSLGFVVAVKMFVSLRTKTNRTMI